MNKVELVILHIGQYFGSDELRLPTLVSDIAANLEVDLPAERFFKCGDLKDLHQKLRQLIDLELKEEEQQLLRFFYILDTNVVSELRKAKAGKADKQVTAWAAGVSRWCLI